MTNKEKQEKDKDGYLLIPKKFDSKGHSFEFVENVEDSEWQIYQKIRKETGKIYYELIKPIKHEEYVIAGNKIPKGYSYPGTSSFGRNGFDCLDIARCYHIYNTWVKPREAANEEEKENPKKDRKLFLPKKSFCVKDLMVITENKDWTNAQIGVKLKELLEKKKIKIVGEKPNKIGKPSKIYSLV